MTAVADILSIFGLVPGLGERARDEQGEIPAVGPVDLIDLVRAGLPVTVFEHLLAHLQIREQVLADLVHLKRRTRVRRRAGERFTPVESDQLCRIARTFAQAHAVLGDVEAARVWLQRPNRALKGRAPLDLLDTDAGTGLVEEELVRIEHGVFG